MVVVASVGLIMTALVGLILGSFRVKNRNTAMNKVLENGTWIINELRKNTFNSFKDSIVCSEVDNLSIQIKNVQDGGLATLTCDQTNARIASVSATKQDILNNKGVEVVNCNNFAICEVDENGDFVGVSFNFGLRSVVGGVEAKQSFSTKVTLRN